MPSESDEDKPVTVPPEILAKDEADLNVFDRLLGFAKQVHVVTVNHAALGPVKVHYAVLEAGEEPKVERKDTEKLDVTRDPDPSAFLNALTDMNAQKAWAMIQKAMRIDVCSNSCCHGPIDPRYRIAPEQWDALKKAYPDFTRGVSSYILGAMQRDVADFLPFRKGRE